jgi:hypothetical protein
MSQTAVDAAFQNWLNSAIASGGCNGQLSNDAESAPPACGGSTTVTFYYYSSCEPLVTTCSATFTVTEAPPVVLTCPANTMVGPDFTQAQINAAFTAWLASVRVSGGCNTEVTNNNNGAPTYCGQTVTVTFTATSSCEAPVTCSATFTVTCIYCSYTQGYWGNKNGLRTMQNSGILNTPIILGNTTGNSVLVPAGSWVRVNQVMPGGSTPQALTFPGQCNILDACFTNNYLTSLGKINNVLLSQTLALSLNTRLQNGKLATLKLGNGCFVTSGGNFQVNQNVINYLGANATVQDLLNLANDVLGGVKVPGVNGVPSFSDINSAVDAINNGFDGCRLYMGQCTSAPIHNNMIVTNEARTEVTANGVTVTAFPNPFTDRVSFRIQSQISGQATLDVFNTLGEKIQTVYKGFIFAGVPHLVDLRLPNASQSNLFYVLRVGSKSVSGKLIQLK